MALKGNCVMICSSMLERPEPVIGFCFSFPVEQASVNSGKLLRWTKGYTNPGAVGEDPAKLLAEAFRRKVTTNGTIDQSAQMMQDSGTHVVDGACASRFCTLHNTQPGLVGNLKGDRFERHWHLLQDIQANIGALINDTVGVLAAVRYIDGTDTFASVIMGTGAEATNAG